MVLAGSVPRIDVLVIADDLPARLPERLALLGADAPGGIQVVGLTPDELRLAARRKNRLVLDAAAHGIVLVGSAQVLADAGVAARPAVCGV